MVVELGCLDAERLDDKQLVCREIGSLFLGQVDEEAHVCPHVVLLLVVADEPASVALEIIIGQAGACTCIESGTRHGHIPSPADEALIRHVDFNLALLVA